MRRVVGIVLCALLLAGCNSVRDANDPKAQKLFGDIRSELGKVRSLQVSIRDLNPAFAKSPIIKIAYLDDKHYREERRDTLTVADGESLYTVDKQERTYDRSSLVNDLAFQETQVWGFPSIETSVGEGEETCSFVNLSGERVLKRHIESDLDLVDVYYSLKSHLPIGYRQTTRNSMGPSTIVKYQYSELKLNPQFDQGLFAFERPANYRFKSERIEDLDIKIGDTFPVTKLSFIGRDEIDIQKLARRNSGLLVVFWSHG